MKRNLALFTGVIAFVLLFYRQDIALNFSIFAILLWMLLLSVTLTKHRTKTFWLLSAAVMVSAAAYAWYADFASFVPLFFSLLILGYKARFPRLNIVTFPVAMFCSYASSPFRMLFIKNWLGVSKNAYSNFWSKLFSFFIIPAIFVSVFLVLYSMASDTFASYLSIDWNFNILQIIFLTCLGFFLMFNYFHLFVPKFLIKSNVYLKDDFSALRLKHSSSGNFYPNIMLQRKSGEITLLLLNLVLLFFIFVYATESNLTPEVSYSSEVHERVYVLIASIGIAVAVIMIWFYTPANFSKEAKLLKLLSYIWIALNAALVMIAILKTGEYVGHYGLTFKRVGVYAFLILCLAGLVVTSYKLMFIKTNIYLLNRMFWVFYVAMVVGLNINWSWVVTKYNISQQKTDIAYLNSLKYNKKIMFDKFGNNPLQCNSCSTINEGIQSQKKKPWLSRSLYYHFITVEK